MTERRTQNVSIQTLAPLIQQIVDSGGIAEFTPDGQSMMPLLIGGESCVRLAAIQNLRRGDIIFYRRNDGNYVLHRIVSCEADGTFTMCGDAQWRLEPGIHRDQMYAQLCAFSRKKRWRDCTWRPYQIWLHFHLFILPIRRLYHRGLHLMNAVFKRTPK